VCVCVCLCVCISLAYPTHIQTSSFLPCKYLCRSFFPPPISLFIQHDAACRVIARLVKERDDARHALSQMQASGASSAAAMEVDTVAPPNSKGSSNSMPANIVSKLQSTSAALSQTRRKRPKPDTLPSKADIGGFGPSNSFTPHKTKPPGVTSVDVHRSSGLIATGGMDKEVRIFDIGKKKVVGTGKGHTKRVTCVRWLTQAGEGETAAAPAVASASQDGTVRVWAPTGKRNVYENTVTLSDNNGSVTSLSVHPSAISFSPRL